jgi:hypothetical protein
MKQLLPILIILFLYISINAQAPDTLWIKTFGGSSWDNGWSIQQTDDFGYIISGATYSFGAGNSDVWLIKTDDAGENPFTKTFGGSNDDIGYSVQQTSDLGYIIAGKTFSFGAGLSDLYIVKTDAAGDYLSSKTFGGGDSDEARSIQVTNDNGFIIAGLTASFGAGSSDILLVKTDSGGDTIWTRTFGGTQGELGYSVQKTADNGYIVVGSTYSFGSGGLDVYLIRVNSFGDTVWTKTFGGSDDDEGYYVAMTSEGGYIICGYSNSFTAGAKDVFLIKTNSSGDTLCTKTFGGVGFDEGYSVQQTSDGGYIICGRTNSFGSSSYDLWLIKTNEYGDTIWTKTLGGSSYDYGNFVKRTSDNGYIICGTTGSFAAGYSNVWLIKTAPDFSAVDENLFLFPENHRLSQNYPNPFNPSTKVIWLSAAGSWQTLKVYDLWGNEIATLFDEYKPAGRYEVELNAADLPSGVYFYQLRAGSFIQTKKMLFLK